MNFPVDSIGCRRLTTPLSGTSMQRISVAERCLPQWDHRLSLALIVVIWCLYSHMLRLATHLLVLAMEHLYWSVERDVVKTRIWISRWWFSHWKYGLLREIRSSRVNPHIIVMLGSCTSAAGKLLVHVISSTSISLYFSFPSKHEMRVNNQHPSYWIRTCDPDRIFFKDTTGDLKN